MSELTKFAAPIRGVLFPALAIMGLFAAVASAQSQTPAQPPLQQPQSPSPEIPLPPSQTGPAQAPVAESAPRARENPGLINEIGKLLAAPKWELPALKNPFTHHDGGTSTDGPSRLATLVKGRMLCPLSANGAPDCKSASDRLCQSKGFKEGKSLDTDASQRCSARVFIPGHKREEGDCTTENFVTQALCQ